MNQGFGKYALGYKILAFYTCKVLSSSGLEMINFLFGLNEFTLA